MSVRHQDRWRWFFASLCLAAVVLLHAPFGAAAWAAYAKTCCTSRAQCPIHGHRHSQTPANSERTMDCSHDMAATAQCSMSCCQNPDRPAVASAMFVFPVPATISVTENREPLIVLSESLGPIRSFEPLSPPPRFSSTAA